MGEDERKSFWMPIQSILTGIAAIIVATGGIYASHESVPTTPTLSPTPSPLSQSVCDAKLPGVNFFGRWNWVGNNNDIRQPGLLTFKSDCTYTNVAKSEFTGNDEGVFIISSSHAAIKLQNKMAKNTLI